MDNLTEYSFAQLMFAAEELARERPDREKDTDYICNKYGFSLSQLSDSEFQELQNLVNGLISEEVY